MSRRELHAVILAAGRGERLRPLTLLTPKPLLPIAGVPLLGRTCLALQQAGICKITLITGYRERQLKKYVRQEFPRLEVEFVRNPVYAKTNTMYSLWMAGGAIRGKPFVLIDGDLAFESKVLELVLAPAGNLLLCDAQAGLDREAVKAYGGSGRRILRIGKNAEGKMRPLGESIGLAKINAQTSRRLFDACSLLIRSGGARSYYEAAFQNLIDKGAIFDAIEIGRAKWVEIDTKADLRRARALFSKSARRGG